jgi:cytochrome P450
LKHLFSLRKDPLGFLKGLGDQYGDLAFFKVSGQGILLVNNPDYISEILVVQQANFTKSRLLQRARVLVGDGLLTSEGAFHMRQRRLVQPAFHHNQLIKYADMMTTLAIRTRNWWSHGDPVNVAEQMMKLTLTIVGMTLFSADIEDEASDIGHALTDGLKTFDTLLLPFSKLWLKLPTPAARRFHNALRRLNEVVYELIRERRRSVVQKSDLLSMMLAAVDEEGGGTMTDEQVRDEIMTLLLAGHETTANALTWVWYLLATNPECEAKLHDEIDSVLGGRRAGFEDLPRLRYTEMVFAETLRLFPPFWCIGRISLNPFILGDREIPAETVCVLSPYVTQRDSRFYPQPERFDPERWNPEKKTSRPKLVYYPFGGGGRLCVGERFAWMESVLAIVAVAQKWKLRVAPGFEVKPKPLVTLRPKDGMRMVPEHRRAFRRMGAASSSDFIPEADDAIRFA